MSETIKSDELNVITQKLTEILENNEQLFGQHC